MHYHEIQPKLPVAQFVECFWTLENGDVGETEIEPDRILPDGCVELILNFGAQFQEHLENEKQVRQPLHFLVGQMTTPLLISPTGIVQLIGIRFHPGGTLPFFSLPMQEITNRVVELGVLDSRFERDLISCAERARSLPQKVAAVEGLLAGRVNACQRESWLLGTAARIVRHHDCISVDQLATDAGISNRQLERRFLQEVGIGPKLLGRIVRFQQVFRTVEGNDPQWAAVAAECGYYDQSHLVRDFQQFARQTPSVLFSHPTPLGEFLTRKNRMSDFSNTSF
jgi:AraC-like DNA-binding protein